MSEITINKHNKSITFINNGIVFSQFGIADEILDLITNLQEKNKELKKKITFNEKTRRKMQQSLMEQIETYKSRNEKAIKCIKDKYYKEEYERKGAFANKLMNILQGADKE